MNSCTFPPPLPALRFLGVLIFLLLPKPAVAQDWLKKDTVVTFAPLAAQPLGRSVGVSLKLADKQGKLIPYRRLEFFIGGEWIESAHTNSKGIAKIRIDAGLPAGQYTLKAAFDGYKNYLSSSATTTLTFQPAVLTVSTVPPLEGVNFSLDGRVFSTAANGTAQITVSESGVHQLEVLPWSTPSSRATFIRWKNGIFEPSRSVEIPRDRSLEAGFNLEHLVRPTFVSLEDQPVSAERVSEVTLKSSYGAAVSFGGVHPVWLQASQVVRRTTGLEAKEISYALESVEIDGSNVVNRGQQRFLVNRKGIWEIELLLYHARFQAVDAVFGFPLGTGVTLEYPDGDKKFLRFGAADEVKIGPLARGLYKVQVVGARGMAPLTPVALSRDQAVELKVLSRLDMGVGLGLGTFFALSLLLLGRPQLVGLKRKPRSLPASTGRTNSQRPLGPEHYPSEWR